MDFLFFLKRRRLAADALRFRRQARYCFGTSEERKQNHFCERPLLPKFPQKKVTELLPLWEEGTKITKCAVAGGGDFDYSAE
jgi:hypothetical protein